MTSLFGRFSTTTVICAAAAFMAAALAAPSEPPGGGEGPMGDDPKALVVQNEDLPVTFALSNGDYKGDRSYLSIFFRPEVLAPEELPEGDLLGVIASVELLDDATEAAKRFGDNKTAEAIRTSMGQSTAVANPRAIRSLETKLSGADDAVLFRVEYELSGVNVVEYRYRLLSSNAIANLIVSGRAGTGGAEPASLASQAQRIADRQAWRLSSRRNE
jgi:hypothetical protein